MARTFGIARSALGSRCRPADRPRLLIHSSMGFSLLQAFVPDPQSVDPFERQSGGAC
jgi:hypothetical protein